MDFPAPIDTAVDAVRRDSRLSGYRPTFATVDLGRLAANYRALAERVGKGVGIIPIVKADAYGHGAVAVARRLSTLGPRAFAVALPEEGVELRRAGISEEILLLGGLGPGQVGVALEHRLTPAVFERGLLERLSHEGRARGRRIAVHVKIDTGMGRIGFPTREHAPLVDWLASAKGIEVTGVFTTFARADEPDDPETALQIDRLAVLLAGLARAGIGPGLVHASNTAGILAHPAGWGQAVRPGLGLYGIHPGEAVPRAPLLPVLALETTVIQVKDVPAGTPIGYGGAWRAEGPARIATLPVGYGDGYPRALGSCGRVLFDGGEGRVAGRVSMDLIAVDATGIEGVVVGSPATLIGERGGGIVTADEIARAGGTIPYETLCGISGRVPRVYVEAGRVLTVRPPATEASAVQPERDR
jgi:alanine racemase